MQFPTATDATLGAGKWFIGPSFDYEYENGRLFAGAIALQLWSFAGEPESKDVNMLMVKPFVVFSFNERWDLIYMPYGVSVYSSPPLVTLVYSAVVGAVVLSFMAPWFWIPPRPRDWGLMVLIGLLAACGHFLIVKAFELAPASRIAPFGYVEIVAATTLGYFVFGDFPDAWAFVGIGIIIVAGVLVSYKAPSEAI